MTAFIDLRDGTSLFFRSNMTGSSSVNVLCLHGGPGSGASSLDLKVFESCNANVVAFDQRGGGLSKPLGVRKENTTEIQVQDILDVADYLGFEKFILFGRSWGSYLALRFARKHPTRCKGMLLFGTFWPDDESSFGYLRRPPDPFRRSFEKISDLVALQGEGDDLIYAVARRLPELDEVQRCQLLDLLIAYESECACNGLRRVAHRPLYSEEQTKAYVAIRIHYHINRYFSEGVSISGYAKAMTDLPISIVHGAEDLICSTRVSRRLSEELPESRFHCVEGASHQAFSEDNFRALQQAAELLVSGS